MASRQKRVIPVVARIKAACTTRGDWRLGTTVPWSVRRTMASVWSLFILFLSSAAHSNVAAAEWKRLLYSCECCASKGMRGATQSCKSGSNMLRSASWEEGEVVSEVLVDCCCCWSLLLLLFPMDELKSCHWQKSAKVRHCSATVSSGVACCKICARMCSLAAIMRSYWGKHSLASKADPIAVRVVSQSPQACPVEMAEAGGLASTGPPFRVAEAGNIWKSASLYSAMRSNKPSAKRPRTLSWSTKRMEKWKRDASKAWAVSSAWERAKDCGEKVKRWSWELLGLSWKLDSEDEDEEDGILAEKPCAWDRNEHQQKSSCSQKLGAVIILLPTMVTRYSGNLSVSNVCMYVYWILGCPNNRKKKNWSTSSSGQRDKKKMKHFIRSWVTERSRQIKYQNVRYPWIVSWQDNYSKLFITQNVTYPWVVHKKL